MRYSPLPNPQRTQHKPRLNEAFRLLRKNGYIARQSTPTNKT